MSTNNSYIVVFKDTATQAQVDQYVERIDKEGGKVTNRYDSVFKGFSANLTETQLSSFQGDGIIQYIEPDQVITIAPPESKIQ